MMKKYIAILAATFAIFSGCSTESKNEVVLENLQEKVLGKWISAEENGVFLTTNKKGVYTLKEDNKGSFSTAFSDYAWHDGSDFIYKIDSNTISWTVSENDSLQISVKHTVKAINEKEMSTITLLNFLNAGRVISTIGPVPMRFARVTVDYTTDILGLWQGKVTSKSSEFDDGETHRWEYKNDGTYVYYVQNADGNWVASDNVVNDYFVDGQLLCTRWVEDGEENREWWEIESIQNGVMKWKALRSNKDESTFTASFEMTKIDE
ncbi:MAG: hypothetical protein J6Z31_02105 [Fibrobacter sp.]|nr:hypothetical protein [Fibrobacter sp.]